ncbi:LysM domain-containing protein [Thermoanaerobacterium sp. RBIITD]|uniref:LysM peptidoglycan-binding domain-containing protein n=1 Tax=Thermoanaerobacterium sp. RBIITD TaxID=1550240 RepID=UPI000BB9A3E8|nr:LysM domain-containing protein [Thermoanaerobacterium sp. RBIITD]SNX53372.1 LysM domain-containing protein [Thermoanaerobacterium sp. RBIITD]
MPYSYCPSGRYYTIGPGDTLWLIAQKTGSTVDDIIKANPGINPNNLQIGQVICLPPIIPYGKTPECPTGVYWEVAPGDTLYSIAQTVGTTVDKILALNPYVNPNYLQVGQVICLPIPGK